MCLGLSNFTVQFNAKFEDEASCMYAMVYMAYGVYSIYRAFPHVSPCAPQCVNQVVVNLSNTMDRRKYKLYLMCVF